MINPLQFYGGAGEMGGWAPVWSGGGGGTTGNLPPILTQQLPIRTPVVITPINPNSQQTVVYQQQGNSNFQQYWNSAVSLASQIVSAFSRNPNQQIVSGGGVMPVQQQQQQPVYAPVNQNVTPGNIGAGGLGTGLGAGLDGIISWGLANPIYPIGAGIILWLLFKQPPGRGR